MCIIRIFFHFFQLFLIKKCWLLLLLFPSYLQIRTFWKNFWQSPTFCLNWSKVLICFQKFQDCKKSSAFFLFINWLWNFGFCVFILCSKKKKRKKKIWRSSKMKTFLSWINFHSILFLFHPLYSPLPSPLLHFKN